MPRRNNNKKAPTADLSAPALTRREKFSKWLQHLHFACLAGVLTDIAAELDAGADIEEQTTDNYQMTPLHCAAYKGQTEAVKLLLDRGANINSREGMGNTPLIYAIHFKHVESAYALLEAGADTQLVNIVEGQTPIELASYDLELQAAVRRVALQQVSGIGNVIGERPRSVF